MDYFRSIQNFEPQEGDLLISEPYLPDPNFDRTVILICEHNQNGSFGYVLNQPSETTLGELINEIDHCDQKVFIGGPVQQDTLHYIHRYDDDLLQGRRLKNGITWGGDYERVLELIKLDQVREDQFKFFMGYSGWAEGQLQKELEDKSWFVYKNASPQLIFETPPAELWKKVLEELGGKFRMISKYPEDPRMN